MWENEELWKETLTHKPLLHLLWGWFKKTTTETSGKTNGKFTMNVMKVQTLTFCNPSLQLCPNPWSAASDNLCFFEREKKNSDLYLMHFTVMTSTPLFS